MLSLSLGFTFRLAGSRINGVAYVFLQDDDGQTITADGDPIILFVE
ncbi:MAG: hypothetical protein KGZ68_12575 [Dechloromonas sp.]|nr:hypothetical protein [Dechloromonas sp.]